MLNFSGNAVRTAISAPITATATTVDIDDPTGWPTENFAVALDRGRSAFEKVLVTSRNLNTLTIGQRGYDDTTAQAHDAGASAVHVLTSNMVEWLRDRVISGTLAARPAAARQGRIYEVAGDTDAVNNGRIFWDTGAAWQEVALLDGSGASRNFDGSLNIVQAGAVATKQLLAIDPGLSVERLEIRGQPATASGIFRIFTNNYTNDVELRSRNGLAVAVKPNSDVEMNVGQVLIGLGTSALPGLSFTGDNDTGLYRNGPDAMTVALGGGPTYTFNTGQFNSAHDNTRDLGLSTHRWRNIYASNGTIQTSDVHAKEDVQPIPDDTATERVRRVGKEAAISYRWPDGTRRHVGFDANQVGVIHGEASAAYIDPTYEANARTNPYTGEPTAEWYTNYVDEDDDADEQAEQRIEAEREWVAAREAFDQETAEMRDAPKGLRPSEMLPDLYAALAKALDRIDQLEARVAALEP